ATKATTTTTGAAGEAGTTDSAAPSETTPGGGPATTTRSSKGKTPGPTTPGQPQTPAVAGPGSSATASPGAVPLQVSLASGCVRAGTPQTITITSDPSTGVAYQTQYSDGKVGSSRDGYGGNN